MIGDAVANKVPKPKTDASVRPNILWLHDKEAAHCAVSGAKGASLSQLYHAHFPVPTGIVVPTSAFHRHLHQVSPELEPKQLSPELERAQREPQSEQGQLSPKPEPDDEQVRQAILRSPLDPKLQEELRQALQQWDADVPLAVRSSAVEEDGSGASFAGQFDTYLGVRGFSAVAEAIRKCWTSAYNRHAMQYRTSKDVPTVSMAVLIQPLIEADVSGVAFTANPVTGEPKECVVSAVPGLGDGLVSGELIPDEWTFLDGETHPMHTTVNGAHPALTTEQVREIRELALRVQTHFGTPQDIEWAIRGQRLYLLQSRPITTLAESEPPQMMPVPVTPPDGYWEREASHYPDPLMPVTRSTFLPAVNHAFRVSCNELALFIETLEVREIGGWVYQRVVPLGGRDRKAPPGWLMPLLIRTVPYLKSRIAASIRVTQEDKTGQWLDAWDTDWKPNLMERAMSFRAVHLEGLSESALSQHLQEVLRFVHDSTEIHMKLNGCIQSVLAEFAFACEDLLEWDDPKVMRMFSGLSDISSAPARALAELAGFVRSIPSLTGSVQAGTDLAELRLGYPEFSEVFDSYMHDFGCRAVRYELAFPTIAELPETVLHLVRDQLQRGYSPDSDATTLRNERTSQRREAEDILRETPEQDRVRFHRALSRSEKAYSLREEHGFHDRDVPLALLRYALLETATRLVARNQLNTLDDIFLLEFDEILDAFMNRVDVRALVHQRQSERNWVLAHPGPAAYGNPPDAPPSMASFPQEVQFSARASQWGIEKAFEAQRSGQVQTDPSCIRGVAASAGHYTGTVRVVHDESEFSKIQPGDVLVCAITSPVWSMVFPSLGGLVTDSGGILSHSAIIAREYLIPSVVATGNATELLKDGEVVLVDGDKGVVTRIQ